MPHITFTEDETIADGKNPVNSKGAIYAGTKYAGMNARWVIIDKDQD